MRFLHSLYLFPLWLAMILQPVSASAVIKVLFLGDSLSAGYGVELEEAYPHLIQKHYQSHINVEVINASISGSTSASAYARLRWGLRNKPDILVLELGANDGLRGLSLPAMEKNLSKTIQLALQHDLTVLLVGMEIPPNYGEDYTLAFSQVFKELATRYNIPLVPFLLEGVAGHPHLNLNDGIHPNAKGHKIMAQTVIKALEPLLKNK